MNILAIGAHPDDVEVYCGGTLAANPLSAMAGYVAIKEIEKNDACAKAGLAGNRLTDGLAKLIEQYDLPYVAYNQGSICHLECTAPMSFDFSTMNPLGPVKALSRKSMMMTRTEAMKRMGAAYMAHGIVTLAGSRLYTSMADTDEVIDEALNHFEDVFKLVRKTGVLSQEVAAYSAAHKQAKAEAVAATKAKQAAEKDALAAKRKAAKIAAKKALAAEKAKKASWTK